jgi:hypothetical protein
MNVKFLGNFGYCFEMRIGMQHAQGH